MNRKNDRVYAKERRKKTRVKNIVFILYRAVYVRLSRYIFFYSHSVRWHAYNVHERLFGYVDRLSINSVWTCMHALHMNNSYQSEIITQSHNDRNENKYISMGAWVTQFSECRTKESLSTHIYILHVWVWTFTHRVVSCHVYADKSSIHVNTIQSYMQK